MTERLVDMSSFDVKKEIRERRLREEAEKIRESRERCTSQQGRIADAPRPFSARSSGHDFGDAESYTIHSEPDNSWYQDEPREKILKQLY